jgi:hypothetical protein
LKCFIELLEIPSSDVVGRSQAVAFCPAIDKLDQLEKAVSF